MHYPRTTIALPGAKPRVLVNRGYGEEKMDKRLERILPRVQKPARYTGGGV